jgi:hypothetical protein
MNQEGKNDFIASSALWPPLATLPSLAWLGP